MQEQKCCIESNVYIYIITYLHHIFLNRLNRCHLSKASCKLWASVLQGTSSHLRELDISDNDLHDEGMELLSVALRFPQCKLQTLRSVMRHIRKAQQVKFNSNSSEMLRVCVCFYLKHGEQAKDRDTENTASAVFMYRCVLLYSSV